MLPEWKPHRCGATTDSVQYSPGLIPRKSAQETKESATKHPSSALCTVQEPNVLHAEHGAIVYSTGLATKQRVQNRYETPGNSIQMLMFSPAVRLQSFPFSHNTMGSRHVIYLHFTLLCRAACETPLKESDECYKQAKLYMP